MAETKVRPIALRSADKVRPTDKVIIDAEDEGTRSAAVSSLAAAMPVGTADVAGRVRVANHTGEDAPTVPLKADVDSAVEAAATAAAIADAKAVTAQSTADSATTTAETALTEAESAVTSATVAVNSASAAQAVATAALAAADSAVAAGGSFPIEDFLGTIETLDADPGDATGLSGKWWQIGVEGTLTDSNAGGLTVAVGDRILSNGTEWKRYLTPPTYLPDGVITAAKVARPTRQQWGDAQKIQDLEWGVMDAANRLGVGIRKDGYIVGKLGIKIPVANGLTLGLDDEGFSLLSLGDTEGVLPLADGHAMDGSNRRDDVLFAITDTANRYALRVLLDGTVEIPKHSSTEVTAARGSRDSVDERLSASLTAHGLPARHTWGEWYLRSTRMLLRKLAAGETAQLGIAIIGDSWSHNVTRWSGPFAAALKASHGDAGPGWFGFSWPSGLPTLYNGSADATLSLATSGTWTPSYASVATPDICYLSSSDVAAKLTISGGPASCSAVRMFHYGGGGTIRYRWNGGSWTNLTLAASTLSISDLLSVPAITWTLEIEVVSGTVRLSGLDIQKASNGVRVHKLAATGSRLSQWVGVDATTWQGGLANLGPDLVVVMHGTNDQAAYDAATYRTHLEALIDRVRSAMPAADVLIVAPCENQRSNTVAMADIQEQAYQTAEEKRTAFLNLQHVFGEDPDDYAAGSDRPWFHVDAIHPDPATGGRAIADAILRTVLYSP